MDKKEIVDTLYHSSVVSGISLSIAYGMKVAFGVLPPALKATARDVGLMMAYGVAGELAHQKMVDLKWIPASVMPQK